MRRAPKPNPSLQTEWRVVESDGQPFPPHSAPLVDRERAILRLRYYESWTQAAGEARLPKLPLSIQWRTVQYGPWNGAGTGLDLVEPLS